MTKCIVKKFPKFNDNDTLEAYGEKAKETGFSCVADVLQESVDVLQDKIKALKERFKIK